MMSVTPMTAYNRLPRSLQSAALTLVGKKANIKRYNREFEFQLHAFEARRMQPWEQIHHYRKSALGRLLYAASKTAFYSKLFDELGATWQEFIDPSTFQQLPPVTKDHLARNIEAFESRPPLPEDDLIETSGTTGASLRLPASANLYPTQWALWWAAWKWLGIERGTPWALFASNPIVPPSETKVFWRQNLASRETRYSVYHISPATAPCYVRQLNRDQNPWIHGNPSAITLLATYMLRFGIELEYRPRWITTSSENLPPSSEHLITKAFGTRPTQHYGLAEANANFSGCSLGRMHVDEDFAFVEFLPSQQHESLRVLGTGFFNHRTVVLRYDTGDLATLGERCNCGHWGRTVASIDGREGDYVTLPSGARVSSLASPFHACSWMTEGQLYQTPDGELTVRYVPSRPLSSELLSAFELELRLRVGHAIAISFEEHDRLPRTRGGKVRLVTSDYSPIE
jgi:phenylacetate-CoA ligase